MGAATAAVGTGCESVFSALPSGVSCTGMHVFALLCIKPNAKHAAVLLSLLTRWEEVAEILWCLKMAVLGLEQIFFLSPFFCFVLSFFPLELLKETVLRFPCSEAENFVPTWHPFSFLERGGDLREF